ncbi:uncharacterized protein LOC128388973 isoform X1 [Panonychus citri]|uniref:uncharacterized protein LOC128388973 isoform X1 n=1 Tax=Panonychus citri TaxID=50023 RepID=UPI002307BB03|nr:uncharacterized protein LOC128388973 isoform X1 [Panonychus citri]
MSLNDLPDNCLLKILRNVHEAKDLIRLSKVCSRWSDLITPRFKRVKYLRFVAGKVDYIDGDSLRINHDTDWKDYNLIEFFPNLKIIEVSSYYCIYIRPDIFIQIISNPNVKGLIGLFSFIRDYNYNLENIEMCVGKFDFDYKRVFRPNQLKQIRCFDFNMKYLPSFIGYFPNLKRLNIEFDKADQAFYNFCNVLYNGPSLSSLKILELGSNGFVGKFTGFHFMDFCPSLESAFISCWAYDIHVDESIKNYNLRDLVIDNVESGSFSWPILKRVLSKFPNLHHLAMRNIDQLDDSNLEELIKLLRKLKILDLRGFKKETQKSADLLFKYCVKENRSIAIYYDCENEPVEWPKLVYYYCGPICYGFDFMKHCFYKKFSCLPDLIDE